MTELSPERRAPRALVLCALVALALPAAPARGADATAEIRAEIARLRGAVNAKPDADPEWKRFKPRLASLLAQASDSLAAGRFYLSLEELEAARSPLRAFETAKDPAAPEKDHAAFETAWKKTSGELAATEPQAAGFPPRLPAAVRALAESALGTVRILLAASLPYASVESPKEGYLYMGEAKAAAETARFCSLLHTSRPQTQAPPPLRSVAPELRVLQERTVAIFKPPRSVEQHAGFIALSSTLKAAGELDAAKLYAGALYKLLDATEQLGALEPRTLDAAQRSAVKQSLAALRGRLAGSTRDDSIGLLFVERAEAHLAGPAPGEDDWKIAAVVAEQVLPAYFAYLQAPSPGAPPRPPATGALAVTLVRWPYT